MLKRAIEQLSGLWRGDAGAPGSSRHRILSAAIATVLAASTTGLLVLQSAAPADRVTRIQLATTYQTMEGFGTAIGDGEVMLITDGMADLLWDPQKGIGLSIFRQTIDPDGQPSRDMTVYPSAPWDLWGHVHKAMLRNASQRPCPAAAQRAPPFSTL